MLFLQRSGQRDVTRKNIKINGRGGGEGGGAELHDECCSFVGVFLSRRRGGECCAEMTLRLNMMTYDARARRPRPPEEDSEIRSNKTTSIVPQRGNLHYYSSKIKKYWDTLNIQYLLILYCKKIPLVGFPNQHLLKACVFSFCTAAVTRKFPTKD